MQVYYLHKRGLSVGMASSALIVRFFALQFALTLYGTVLWITNAAFIAEQLGGNIWYMIAGYSYNMLLLILLMLVALKRGIVGFIIRAGIKIGVKLHLIRNPE